MKKLMLCTIFGVLFINVFSQDTTCTMVQQNRVLEFNYKTNEVINLVPNTGNYFINVREGEVLVLHLYDKEARIREIITTYPDNHQIINTFDSKDNVYYSPIGPLIVEVKESTMPHLINSETRSN